MQLVSSSVLVTTSKALVTSSDALVTSSDHFQFLLPDLLDFLIVKLLGTSASLLVTSALLLGTRSY